MEGIENKMETAKMKLYSEKELKAVAQVIREGELSSFYRAYEGGCFVKDLEEEWERILKVKHAIAVSSGTAALHCAYLAAGIGKGDYVFTSPYSFVATASMLKVVGAHLVFIDVEKGTPNIDLNLLDQIMPHFPSAKAFVPVHILGIPVDLFDLKTSLDVIEDAAQAFGSKIHNYPVGTLGDMGCFSGQQTKTCSFGGEGGMVVTDDDELADKILAYRNHGEKYAKPKKSFIGFNYRLTEMQAAFGLEQTQRRNVFIRQQTENALYLIDELPECFQPIPVPKSCTTAYWILGMTYEKKRPTRRRIIEYLTAKGWNKLRPGATVGSGYSELITDLPAFSEYTGVFPNARAMMTKAFWIDCHRFPRTTKDMARFVRDVKKIVR